MAAEELTEIQADGKKMEDENDALSEWAQPYYKESELCPELKSEMKKKAYPNNINFQDYAYFLVAPTLVNIRVRISHSILRSKSDPPVLPGCLPEGHIDQDKKSALLCGWNVRQLHAGHTIIRGYR